jgi:signal transduction histidine kinase
MGLLLNSALVRVAGILLAIGVAVILLMAWALFEPIGRERMELYVLPLPTQSAAIVDVLDAAPLEMRPRVLDALNSRALSVQIVDSMPQETPGRGRRAAPIERFFARYNDVFAEREFHLVMRQRSFITRILGREVRNSWEPSKLYVRLHDGPFVVIEPARAALFDGFLARALAFLGFAGLFVIAGLVLAVRQTTKPVQDLAANARAFAANLAAPALPEAGAPALRDLAAAFNHMKTRIRDLVDERTRLLAAIAHDLRTYLTRLRLRAEFIEDANQRARAERDIAEMSALIDDTLVFAQASTERGTEAAACDLAAEVRAALAARAELGESVTAARIDEGLKARLSPLGCKRILSNLIDNAVRYGGAARVSAFVEDEDIVLRVEDDGPGIPEHELDRITAPFERLEPSRGRNGGGAGLGLAIVRALVEAHGGTLTLRNRLKGGLSAEARVKRIRPNILD